MSKMVRLIKAIALSALLPCVQGSAGQADTRLNAWPDTGVNRLKALAFVQTLNSELLSHDSATLTLDRWCKAHHLASNAQIVADQVRGVDKVPTLGQRELLHVGEKEPIKYRRVRLRCGDHILSEADNWYVPSRLTEEMNQKLGNSDIAFGRAVGSLKFRRQTFDARLLWEPLPSGWELTRTAPSDQTGVLQIPHAILQHSAKLTLPNGLPFSLVVETYTRDILSFPLYE